MNRWTLIALSLALSTAVSVRAESPLALTTPVEARHQNNFVALHGAAEVSKDSGREVYHGEALGRRLWVNSFGSTVSGEGPLGQINLWYTGNSITGSSGGRPVNLTAWGGTVSGYGAHGYVSLSANGSSIFGRVGNGHVSITVMGNWANGTYLGHRFNLSGFQNLNPVALAALVGAL